MSAGALAGLPTGTVTFVLTDIERSTALWETHGDDMGRSVERHEAIIASATAKNGGVLVRSRGEGDSCFLVFTNPIDAVRAVLEAQLGLAREPWVGPAVRVRIAVHTGSAELRDGQYYGTPVNRCARLRGTAHGGQSLLSGVSAGLVGDALPADAVLVDLGSHRLPDLAQPERVYQLTHADLPDVFPALNSLDALPNNLPVQLTRFVDREEELADLVTLLQSHRLVTLTGPGGSGKTRLALQAAASFMDAFPDGVWLVRLSAVSDAALVGAEIASALGLREEPGRPLLDSVTDYLERRSVLIVLDNCEHILAAAARAGAHVLARCSHVKVIATSRQALGIEGEVARPLLPLSVPDGDDVASRDELMAYGAVQLLCDRAGLASTGFDVTDDNASAVAHICRRLDGIPLAIEFAASRLGSLGPAELARRLDDRFRLLSGARRTGPQRHQTLEAAVDWSYELLDDPERLLFRRLAIFTGPFTLDAAEAVCEDDELLHGDIAVLLMRLVDRSLVFADTRGPDTSYRILSTIRVFSLQRLEESGEAGALRDKHLAWFVRLAEDAEPELVGAEQVRWFDVLTAAHDNIRAALAWGIRTDPISALRLGAALGSFWDTRGHWTESRRWLEDAIAAASRDGIEVARALRVAGNFASQQGDRAAAEHLLERALELSRAVEDEHGTAHTLTLLGTIAASTGAVDEARAYFDQGLEIVRRRGYEQRTVGLLINLAMSAQARGDSIAAELYREALALSREHGHTRGIAGALSGLGTIAQAEGDIDRARASYDEALALFRGLGDKTGTAITLSSLAVTSRALGDLDEAYSLLSQALPLHRDIGDKRATAVALARLGTVAWSREDLHAARDFHTQALGLFRELGDTQGLVGSLVSLGRIARATDDVSGAESWLAQALDLCGRAPEQRTTATCLEELAGLEVARDPERAARLFGAADAIRVRAGATGPRTGQAVYEADVASLRARLAPDALERAWAGGRATSAADAVAYASEVGALH